MEKSAQTRCGDRFVWPRVVCARSCSTHRPHTRLAPPRPRLLILLSPHGHKAVARAGPPLPTPSSKAHSARGSPKCCCTSRSRWDQQITRDDVVALGLDVDFLPRPWIFLSFISLIFLPGERNISQNFFQNFNISSPQDGVLGCVSHCRCVKHLRKTTGLYRTGAQAPHIPTF